MRRLLTAFRTLSSGRYHAELFEYSVMGDDSPDHEHPCFPQSLETSRVRASLPFFCPRDPYHNESMTIADESQRVSRAGWPKTKALWGLRAESLGEPNDRNSGTINEPRMRPTWPLKKGLT